MAEHSIPIDILDDLSSRFIINIPEEERKDHIRICFQIELAHWFYLDFYCTDDNPKLKSCNMKVFTSHIFKHIPFLKPHVPRVDAILKQWRDYKQNVPTFGAIVLNEDLSKVLLVQSFWSKSNWGFPKGKINEGEDPSHCAVREVFEETGFDISRLIDKNEYIESTIHDQVIRLYIIYGVQKDTKFEPRTRKEIKNVEWFDIDYLPNNKKDMTPKVKIGVGPNAFFMVIPFVKDIKRWIQEKNQKDKTSTIQAKRHRHKSLGGIESNPKSKRLQTATKVEVIDIKYSRQANTSPTYNRTKVYENKNITSKGAFKRNLFGELNGDPSSAILAKQLIDTPLKTKFNISNKESINQIKRIESVSNKASATSKDKKDNNCKTSRKITSVEKSLPLKTSLQYKGHTTDYSFSAFNFKTQIWMDFKFDKKSIVNCL